MLQNRNEIINMVLIINRNMSKKEIEEKAAKFKTFEMTSEENVELDEAIENGEYAYETLPDSTKRILR